MSHHHHTTTKPLTSRRRRSSIGNQAAFSREIPTPNVIARLMGIDATPFPPKPAAAIVHPTSSSDLKPPATATAAETKAAWNLQHGDYSLMKKMPGRSRSRQRRRHPHPQEDLLQKIRHDFQAAWQQASDTCSANQLLDIQMIAQENLRKEKMARYYGLASSMPNTLMEDDQSPLKNTSMQQSDDEPKTVVVTVQAARLCAGAAAPGTLFRDEELRSSTTPIVLLKPTSSDVDAQEPPFGLPKVKRDANMSRFLQEVKGTLQQHLEANANRSNKEAASKRFFRSESFRGFRSDRKRDEAEHARRNLLAHRITGGDTPRVRAETVSSSPNKDDEEESMSSSCSITSTGERVRSPADGVSPSAIVGEQSFRSECLMMDASSSARALFRSLSAPELGLSFSLGRGRLSSSRSAMHDDASQGGSAAAMASKNSTAFGFLRFSNLLRRKTSKKKTSLVEELHPQMAPPSPQTLNLFKVAQANLTELPPSPVSPLEVAGHGCRHLLADFNCTLPLPEMSPKCLSEFEAPASEISYRTDATVETACDRDKAYIREVLVAAGLYEDGSSWDNNKANARVDSATFEEVEDIYYYRGKYCDDAITMGNDAATDHRMLFDLANEALQSLVQGANKTGSSLRQWIVDTTAVPRGRRLVDHVWHQVQTLRNPQMLEMKTIDSMVAYEIRKSAWAEVLFEDAYVVGRKIERAIFDELIQDLSIEVLRS